MTTQEAPAAPQLNVLAQYVKDLSFENPNAPQSLAPAETPPQVSINVNVSGKPLSETEIEVDLTIEAKAERAGSTLFAVEVVYAGLFRVMNVPAEHLHPFVMIECPRLLFPFARQLVAEQTRNGGFMPLMIDPIDFVALYQQNAEAAQAQAQPN
ncbi:MAG: protein-export chaperone SecB [Hyphomicrobiaceae bacterium]|nr:protein-export chaperone SecB [Hyphomicrobiaceae bacterium]